MVRTWDDLLTERDVQVYAKAGYGRSGGCGARPAILVIDVSYDFVGDKPEPIMDSIEKFPNSCGEEGWEGVYRIRDLLSVARAKDVPIIYTTAGLRDNPIRLGAWGRKNAFSIDRTGISERLGPQIVAEIAPQQGDIVVYKDKPSAFFGTPLMSYLHALRVDTIIVAGATTSGCVRATVVDAFSYNLQVIVVEECTFDRGQTSHKVNLFDINQKYADVLSMADVVSYLESLMQNSPSM